MGARCRPVDPARSLVCSHTAYSSRLSTIEGRSLFVPRPAGRSGLINQGATCYMNSLLQVLFMTPEFRHRVFGWSYDEARDGDAGLCVPLQLQRLFAHMLLSDRAALTTTDLTRSFRWTAADAFRQHDAQEMARVLLDALDRCSPELGTGLFRGVMVDYLRSLDATHAAAREREDPFMDVELTVVGLTGVLVSSLRGSTHTSMYALA